jgi:BASS family bile acid:Na+ symporter
MRRPDERLIAGLLLASAIIAGFGIPGLSSLFAPYVQPALFVMILASLVPMARLDLSEVFSLEPNVLKIVFWQLFVLPAIILAGAHLLKIDMSFVKLIAVTACAGSLFASPALAGLLGLNQRRALQCMVLSTFIMPFSYFVFLTLILHSEIEIVLPDFIGRTGMFLLLPASIFLFYSAFAQNLSEDTAQKIEGSSRWINIASLMVFGVGIVGPAADLLAASPGRFLIFLVIVTLLGAGMAFMTAIVMYRQGITNALTASIVSGFRNVGLGFVLIQGSASAETAAYVGVSQIPIFLAPLVMRFFIKEPQSDDTAEQPPAGKQLVIAPAT